MNEAISYVQVPDFDLPSLPDWPPPRLTPLPTPSFTAGALARAQELIREGFDARSRRVHNHAADLAQFARCVRELDADHGFGDITCW